MERFLRSVFPRNPQIDTTLCGYTAISLEIKSKNKKYFIDLISIKYFLFGESNNGWLSV